jgi:LmbE family N-acetylglucosaminyl deacetylase
VLVLADDEISRILAITAHPDDVDFGAAGTIARWTDAGLEVIYCIVTDGNAGGSDRSVSRADMATLRRAEQTAAAKQVGVHDLRFLGYQDGQVEATLALRRDLARVIRQVRPDRVVSQSPERNYARPGASHPDHRAVGSATLDAVYPDARNPFAFPELLAAEGLEPWTVREVWISGTPASGPLRGRRRYLPAQDGGPARPREPDQRPRSAGRAAAWLARPQRRRGRPAGRPPRRSLPGSRHRLTELATGGRVRQPLREPGWPLPRLIGAFYVFCLQAN